MEPAHHLVTILLGAGLCLAPGWSLLVATGADRLLPAALRPAAATTLTLVLLTGVAAASLALEQRIAITAGAIAALTAVLALCALAGARTRVRRGEATSVWVLARSGCARFVREIPPTAWVVMVLLAALAYWVGSHAWNDSLYHIGQAQKLRALSDPSFTNTLQFADGTAHPGYLVPVWQEVVALVSFGARIDPVTTAWLLPVVTVPLAALSIGGLGVALTRAPAVAGPVAAAYALAAVAMTAQPWQPIYDAMHPGSLVLGIVLPLVIGALVTVAWPAGGPAPAGGRGDGTRGLVAVIGACVIVIAVLHVTYLMLVGLAGAGYALWALLAGPVGRRDWLRLARGVAVVAIVGGLCLAVLVPHLAELESFGADAQSEFDLIATELYEGKNRAALDELFVGSAERYHLRPDYLVGWGGMMLAGVFAVLVSLRLPRWPGGWYLCGATLLVFVLTQTDVIFPPFAHLVSIDQARRLDYAMPAVAGLGVGFALVVASARAWWERGRRIPAAVLVAIPIALAGWAAHAVDPLAGYAGARIAPDWLVRLPMFLLGGALVLLVAARTWYRVMPSPRAARSRRWRRGDAPQVSLEPPDPRCVTWPGPRVLTARTCLVATLALVVAGTPAIARTVDVMRASADRGHDLPTSLRADELRFLGTDVAAAIRGLPTRTLVLANPAQRTPYQVLAIAPVYVVSSIPRHTANTPGNRVEERYLLARSAFAVNMRPQLRRRTILQTKATALVVSAGMHPDVLAFLDESDAFTLLAEDRLNRVYRIDRAALHDEIRSDLAAN